MLQVLDKLKCTNFREPLGSQPAPPYGGASELRGAPA
jgi:hypothetical protein